MNRCKVAAFSIVLSLLFCSSSAAKNRILPSARLVSAVINGRTVEPGRVYPSIPVDDVVMEFGLSEKMNPPGTKGCPLQISGDDTSAFESFVKKDCPTVLVIRNRKKLPYFTKYEVKLADDISISFVTEYDPHDKFPRISDEQLFEKVQRASFSYFWENAHPHCGLALERTNSGDTVTSGGSGFGLMCIPVAIERGWITREEGIARVIKVLDFLSSAERFHGAWPHWMDGSTGKARPFSPYDDGADLVETSFLVEGLLVLRNYFTLENVAECGIREKITKLWNEVEWDWFRKDGQNVLYWHWSPNFGWKMNMPVTGWNEALITYVLAASSPTHPIERVVYENGWWNYGSNRPDYGDPLFFAHYSFLGLDPRHLKDAYADYWKLNRSFADTNYLYCVEDPKGYGYNEQCWGLTASDCFTGYTASSPLYDSGTVAPSAALASFPYLPEASRKAMKYFYYVLGDRLWGSFGFKDSFSMKDVWFAQSNLAIDQGPIVIMMENYRTGLIWDCFMKDGDVQRGLSKLGFSRTE